MAGTAIAANGAKEHGFRWTIARKIGGLAAILIVFILILLVYSIVTLRGIQAELAEIAELDVPLTELINKVEIEELELQITMDELLRLGKRQGAVHNRQVEAEKRLEEHEKALEKHIDDGIALSELGYQTESRAMFESIHASLIEVRQEAGRLYPVLLGMVEKIDAGGYPSNQEIDDLLVRDMEFDEKILALIKVIETFTEREIEILESHERMFMLVNSALGVAAVLIGSILSMIIIVGIRKNLFRLTKRISQASQAIAESGAMPQASLEVTSSDEIGKLAGELSAMFDQVHEDFQQRDELSRHLRQLATTDKLTGAANRLKWEENLALEIERARRSQDELSLTIFDIDFFKKVNDTFGHDVGDRVLIEVVAEVEGQIRQTDTLYRIGGEEFAVLTPNTNQQQAAILADKVRQAIEARDFDTVGTVTVSMGCVQFEKKGGDDAEKMFKRADQALYQAKESGRNQVKIAA